MPVRLVLQIQLVESNFFWGNLSGIGVAADRMFDVLNDIEYLRIRGGFGQVRPVKFTK